jgi:hypothetical protein
LSKKRKIIFTSAILLAIFMSFIGGQTFSKYISEVKVTGSANIASWSFKVNDSEEQMQTISLASTMDNYSVKGNKLAPGTHGSFHLKIDGSNTEVGFEYKVKFLNITDKPKNLTFTYGGVTLNNLQEFENQLVGTFYATATNKIEDIKIEWEWPFETGHDNTSVEENNKQDTLDANKGKDYTFDVVVTGTQVLVDQ